MNLSMHLLELEITTRCNLNCLHCYNRGEENVDFPFEQILKYIHFANDNNVSTLIFSGGEACLHKDFGKICEYLKENRKSLTGIKKITLQTNGLIKNMNLENLHGFDYIHLSFDIDENGLREISLSQTVELANNIKSVGIKPYFFTTVHKKNLEHIDDIVKIANDNEINIAFNFCIDTGRDKEFLLSSDEKREAISKLLEYENSGKINKLRNPYVNSFKKMTLNEGEKFKIKGGCTAGIASCDILANGDVLPCPFLRKKAGNIYKENLEDIWLNSELFSILRNRKAYKKCGECKYLAYCGGCRESALTTSKEINGYDGNCIIS